tara:strand:+ start:3417 stop:4778 length:1362 start_codon:yes stop_codon:yes gene_type:complete
MATLNPVLRSFWKQDARNYVLYGGRASSKSWDAAGFAVFLSQYCKIRFLCTRQFQNKIEESVYSLIKSQIERFGLSHDFKITNNKIQCLSTGSEFIFYGLWRHIDEIKSLEGIDVCWIEEAHNLTPHQWEILEPTIRKQGSKFWVIFNPNFLSDFSYQRFVVNPPANTVTKLINYTENEFLSQTALDVIDAAFEEDAEEAQHVYLGIPRQDDDSVIIKRSMIEAAIDSHIKLGFEAQGDRVEGYDVADSGQDKNATCSSHGVVVYAIDEWKGGENELMKSCKRVHSKAEQNNADWIVYDSIGVGAGCGSKFAELGDTKHHGFCAGAGVLDPDKLYRPKKKNKDMFANIKAQAWWLLADRFRKTYDAVQNGTQYDPSELISIQSKTISSQMLEKLKAELSTPRVDYDNAGKCKVESKKDLAKREVKSPNLADAFVMCFAPKKHTISKMNVRFSI